MSLYSLTVLMCR